eukprot:3209742-Rhodomonas_salina.3
MLSIVLRLCYAMSGTDLAFPTLPEMPRYHPCGVVWGRRGRGEVRCMMLRACYAKSGTDLAYAATRRGCMGRAVP